MQTLKLLLPFMAAFFCASLAAHAAPASYVWLEGEAPSSIAPAGLKTDITDVGTPQYLSGGKWMHVNVGGGDVAKTAPDGVTLTYDFTAPAAGSYQIWGRMGYQASRSEFDWRVDNGALQKVPIGAPFIDTQQLQTWNDVSWMHLGDQTLTAGAHTFTFVVPKTTDGSGKTQDMNFACDAVCLSNGPFTPNDQYKPDDASWQSDADKAAATKVFDVTAPADAAQTATDLSGNWQMARDEEETIHDVDGPIASVADENALGWKAMPVPGVVGDAHPEWLYAHRYLLRTQINVPASLTGRSLVLHFPAVNMLATVFVNGQPCGFDNTPFAAFDCDITRAVKPGQANEVTVGVKDWYYSLPDLGAKDGGFIHYTPTDWVYRFGPASFTYPMWNNQQSGLIAAPSLIVGGPVYTSDVFCKPSVQNKSLDLQVTLNNPTGQDRTVSVGNTVAPLAGGPAEKTFQPVSVTVPAGGSKTVDITEGWASPKLWWPDEPNQYVVTTTLSDGGNAIDSRATKFGFREWTWNGDDFKLNGIPWHIRADDNSPPYATLTDDWLAGYHAHGQTEVRMWGVRSDDASRLDWFDSHGVNVRWTSIFDGEGAGYHLDTPGLWDHYEQQLAAWIKGVRNHPGIFIWSVENEITFINGHVTGQDQLTTDDHHKTIAVMAAADPTRPYMTDGGNAHLDESFPIYGGHYLEAGLNTLPDGAYNNRAAFAHRQTWPITQHKPIMLGEAYFSPGYNVADFATIGGEEAFLGKAEAAPANSLIGRIFSEGYRWDGINFQLLSTAYGPMGSPTNYYTAWQPVAVLCRQWDRTFGAGQSVSRTIKVFNDTRSDDPITLTWTLAFGGKTAASGTKTYHVEPGMSQTDMVTLHMPAAAHRLDGAWTLVLTRGGKLVFKDVKPYSVLPRSGAAISGLPTARSARYCAAGTSYAGVAVYDPSGTVQKFLTSQGVPFRSVASLAGAPGAAKALIVGPDALTSAQASSSALAAYAAPGRAVIVLEQKNPLRFQALPGAMDASGDSGEVAFMENPDDPLFAGLAQSDFFTWGPDGAVYTEAYRKPTSGGRSLVQCDNQLQDSALAEMTPGKGLLLLSQLEVGRKLATNAVAQRLLLNMIRVGLAYKQIFRPVALAATSPILPKTLDATGLQYAKAGSPLAALSHPGGIAVIEATPDNLAALAASPAKVTAFTQGGGWIVFNNLTPDGLASYNKIVGVDHVIRAFGQNPTGGRHLEKVTFAAPSNPLLAGLSASNVVLGSGQQIFGYEAGQYPDENGYSYIVDTGDVAPFASSSWGSFGNIVNGFTQEDGFWPLIINFPAPADGSPFQVPITLPRTETLTRFDYAQDLNYQATTQVSLLFDGGRKQSFAVKPTGDVQSFTISPPQAAKTVTLELDKWNTSPSGQTLLGLDNIWLYAQHPAGWAQKVKPMLNIGALVEYPKGSGGIVLCNVKFLDTEGNPENIGKKQTIIATLLKNLQAPFSGGKSIIAGASDLAYTPIDLKSKVNQYATDQGWFGDKAHTFADLPGGRQVYAGVPYSVYNFTTSPVPTILMLGAGGVPNNLPDHVDGIPVGRKADALFFLQAARIDQPMNGDDIKNNRRFEMADYIIHYADGTTEKVPVYSQISVENYIQKPPAAAVPGAQIAWQKAYPDGSLAVAYSMQWNNPHPDKVIQTIDFVYGPDRGRGVPALLALTAATAH